MILSAVLILAPVLLFAQEPVCKDTVIHHRLQKAMWKACDQDNAKVLYNACKAFQAHANADGDLDSYYNAWVCGIVYNLNRMNIRGVALCHRAIQAMPPVDPTRVQVVFEDRTSEGNGRLCTNEDSLLQMLGNMLENSVKFTDKGHIRLILARDESFMSFTVEDTGCGIRKEDVDHIFERFTKGDEFKEGLGLGLAYCHETAHKLGGNLTLNYTSDKGTSFTLSLPTQLLKT